jgi:hypothetical protein
MMIAAVTETHLWLAASVAAGFLIASGAALLIAVALFKKTFQMSRPASADPANRPPDHACRDIRELMDELDRCARRIDAKVETRMEQLNCLIEQADRTIASSRPESPAGNRVDGKYIAAERDEANALAPPPKNGHIRADHAEILRLAGQGISAIDIARRKNMNVGEVELILNLHRTRPPGR